MRLIVVAVLCALSASVAVAKEASECIIAAGTVAPDFGLPNVARAIAKNKLDIAVIGSASSELNGPAGTSIAYPTWLEKTLRGLLPGVAVKVTRRPPLLSGRRRPLAAGPRPRAARYGAPARAR